MSKKLLDLLNAVGKRIRRSTRPFGGIQVIFSGDFYQLPPVGEKDDPDTSKFCFESEEWNTVFPQENCVSLVKIFRQNDNIYAKILNEIREGKLKRSSYEILMKQVGKQYPPDLEVIPTKLYPTKQSVDYINFTQMDTLETESKTYKMRREPIVGKIREEFTKLDVDYEFSYLEKSINAEQNVTLKVGAQVMCVVNMEVGSYQLCNGSQGMITKFDALGMPVVKFTGIPVELSISPHTWTSERIPVIGISQIPLILAWALTIHKSQGATLELAEIDAGNNIFACGQTYVALSRVKSLEGLYLSAFNYEKILVNKKVKEFYAGNLVKEPSKGT